MVESCYRCGGSSGSLLPSKSIYTNYTIRISDMVVVGQVYETPMSSGDFCKIRILVNKKKGKLLAMTGLATHLSSTDPSRCGTLLLLPPDIAQGCLGCAKR